MKSLEFNRTLEIHTYNQNGNETRDSCIPITITRRLANENRIKNEIAKTKFNAT